MPEHVHLTVPKGFRKRVPVGCVLHVASLTEEETEPRSGYSVTTPLRTLLDLADSALSQEHLGAAVREALERGLVRQSQLQSASYPPEARRLARVLSAAPAEESTR